MDSQLTLLVRRPLAVALTAVLVACSPSTPAPGQAPAAPTPAQSQSQASARTASAPADSWQAEWDRVVAAAKAEKLVLVTQPSSLEKQVVAAFQKSYPEIEVEHVAARPSDISPRVITEQQNGVFAFDVMQGPGNNMNNVLLPANAYQELSPFLIRPDVTDDSKWRGGRFEIWSSTKGKFILNDFIDYSNTAAVYVNRDKIPQSELKDVDDLLDPKFKGRIVSDDCTVAAHGLTTLIGLYNLKGEDFVRKLLMDQQPVFQDTIRITTEWIATGRYPIAIGMDVPTLLELKKNGVEANVERFNSPLPSARGVAVFRNAPHPNAAKVWVNWALRAEGATAWTEASQRWNPPGWNSRRADVAPVDADTVIDFTKFDIQTVPTWGADSGTSVTEKMINLCKEARR
ncbi:MAG: ABC transporter substrate-binding protein [Chloroflexota bacterium]